MGKQGITFTGGSHPSKTGYIFTRLIDIKPEMIEATTTKDSAVALKF
jgi:hypothetical protein